MHNMDFVLQYIGYIKGHAQRNEWIRMYIQYQTAQQCCLCRDGGGFVYRNTMDGWRTTEK